MLDSDDYWPNYKLASQVKSFDAPDIVLSYGEGRVVNASGKKLYYINLPKDKRIACNDPVGSSLESFLLNRNCFIVNSTVVISKKALTGIDGFVNTKGLAHDYPTWTRLSIEGRFSALPVCLGYWRRHLSSTYFMRKPETVFNSGINFLEEFTFQNNEKLNDLGFLYDMESLKVHWKGLNPQEHSYNKAIIMLSHGLFNEGEVEFRKLLKKGPSFGYMIMYFFVKLSSMTKIDLLNPIVNLKSKLKNLL